MPTPTPSPRTLSIGGATYDLFVRTGHEHVQASELRFPLGEKIRVQEVIETCGGGASNTAVGLKRLGCDAGFCGIIGSDQWGDRLRRNFEHEGVDTSAMTVVDDEMSSFSIILSVGSGERTILYEPGTNAHLHDATFDRAAAFDCQWIFLNHIHELSCIIEDDLLNILQRADGPGLSWNPGGCHIERGMHEKLTQALLHETDLLLLNKEEALAFTKEGSMEAALAVLSQAGVKYVCITDGPAGVVATDGASIYRCPVIKDCIIVDTTGAGDAFGTGATWALLNGKTLPEMLRAGTINATSVLGSFGAEQGLLTHTEMHTKLQSCDLVVDVSPLPPLSHVR